MSEMEDFNSEVGNYPFPVSLNGNGSPVLVSAALVDPQRGGQTTLSASQVAAGSKRLRIVELGTPYKRPMSSSGRLSVDVMKTFFVERHPYKWYYVCLNKSAIQYTARHVKRALAISLRRVQFTHMKTEELGDPMDDGVPEGARM
ncbi:jg22249 [Pararge aegeria aegeria]|uniref:Jg22249 protein n=1 Tax=Pararge aegeria aegeria TaxID=348720 RepID=A0A8S4QX12_9NEOP|nr:jg22249 [Pararge aegeria aegeria]